MISGFCLGIEFFFGEDLIQGDKFAMNIDLGIIRINYIITDTENV